MLSAAHRLRDASAFRRTSRLGERFGARTVVLHLRTGAEEQGPARAGIVVSKRVGGAVVRNTVKRRLRHVLRSRVDALDVGSELVVRAKPSAAGASSADLAADVDRALARLREDSR